MVMAICLLLGSVCHQVVKNAQESRGETLQALEDNRWNPFAIDRVNRRGITVQVDGRGISLAPGSVYMDENRRLELAAKEAGRVFACADNVYDASRLVLEKNARRAEYRLSIKRFGRWYIPIEQAAGDMGYLLEWNAEKNRVELKNLYPGESILPARYDYRKAGRRPAVKNQGKFGTCWAVASMTALESAIRPEKLLKLSPDHLANKSGFAGTQNDGGESMMSIAYLTAWKGPVLHEEDPYGDGYSPDGLKPRLHVQEAQIPAKKDYEAIKEAVYRYGGVQSSIYLDMANAYSQSVYYNRKQSAYCYPKAVDPNHDVVIIGWDDRYPKERFNGKRKRDGAFICQNSWGGDFGEDGVFYVSYEDANIGVHNAVYSRVEGADNYAHIYQSDLLGWAGQLGYDSNKAMFANVFRASSRQEIAAVGFYATGKNTQYKVYTVTDFQDSKSLGKRAYSVSGAFSNAGFYTVPLWRPVTVEQGEKFAVVVEIMTPGSVHPVAIEYPSDGAMSKVDLSDGEGYISLNGIGWDRAEEKQRCNICLKVYTNNAS